MVKTYSKGRRIEYLAKEHLKKEHLCPIVVRSAGSKTPVDLIGINATTVFCIQVKYSDKAREPTKKEIIKINEVPKGVNRIRRGIWIWNSEDKEFIKYWY